ncbi:hypothetical protein LguiB_024657 [Lonicera macranthoides]
MAKQISSIDPNCGFCSQTKIYHSLRPHIPLPPQSSPLSVTDYAFSLLQHSPETTAALIDADTSLRVPYSQLLLRVQALAASLQHQIGLSKGDAAFILSPNSLNIPILYLSLFSLSVIVSPSNPASTISEISRQIQLCKPVIAFSTSDTAHKLPSLKYRTILLDSAEFDSMMTSPTANFNRVDVYQSEAAAIMYSSGTTGKVKGVVLTHRNFISMLAVASSVRPVRSSPAVSLCTVPYFHVYGFIYGVRSVALGISLVTMKRFDLRLMMRGIEEFKVTHLPVAPPVVVAMVNNDDVTAGNNLSSLEVVLSGGAPLTNAMVERFKKKFHDVSLVQANESQIIGATGRLDPNCLAKIVDPRTGTGLPPFKQGELWLRGPSLMKGYVDDEEATKTVLDSEGWLRTGDLCYFDSEGFLFFVDRIKELIKYKGYQVAPAELEHLIQSHPDVIDAAVIPYPDEEADQVPMAFVVKRSGSTIDEFQIKDFVAQKVAPYKKIRRVSFINSIPKNAPGKALRKELIKLALSKL